MRELVDAGIMTRPNYSNLARRGRIKVVRPGKGLGNYALVAVDSLPERFAKKLSAGPSSDITGLLAWCTDAYEIDQVAIEFFLDRSQCGVSLQVSSALKLARNASVLDLFVRLAYTVGLRARFFGGTNVWPRLASCASQLRDLTGHTLPASPQRLRQAVGRYRATGYKSLISAKYGNQNARKRS